MIRFRLVAGGITVLAVAFLMVGRVDAQSTPFLVNGNGTLLVFDANGNGVIPDTGDCVVTGSSSGGSAFALVLTQTMATGAVPLQICEPCSDDWETGVSAPVEPATYFGEGAVTVGAATAAIMDTCVEGLGTPYVSVDVLGTGSAPQASAGLAAGGPIEPLVMAISGAIFNDAPVLREDLGSGLLCRAGASPAVAVMGRKGLRMLVSLNKVSSNGMDYQCAPVPIPRADTGAIAMINACVPVDMANTSILSLMDIALVGIDFDMLAACGGERVPTTSEWTLIVLALGLAAGGTLVLRRRQAFNSAMPQF
jgi:hypothetical protein